MKFKTVFAKMTMCSLMLTALFGCGQSSQTADGAQDTQSEKTTELTVFAAASMTETLNQIAEDYKTVDPNVSLTFNFASSGDLLSQIREGADCDVFISAAPKQTPSCRSVSRSSDIIQYTSMLCRLLAANRLLSLIIAQSRAFV